MTTEKCQDGLEMFRMAAKNAPMSLGSRLSDEALRREISHEAAAEMIGVRQATMSRWIKGTNLPSSTYFAAIARFLRTNRDEVAAAVAAETKANRPDSHFDRLEQKLDRVTQLLEDLVQRQARRR